MRIKKPPHFATHDMEKCHWCTVYPVQCTAYSLSRCLPHILLLCTANVRQFSKRSAKTQNSKVRCHWKWCLLIGFVTIELLSIAFAFSCCLFFSISCDLFHCMSCAFFINTIHQITCLRYSTFPVVLSFYGFTGVCKALI